MRMLSRREVLIAGGGALLVTASGGSKGGVSGSMVPATDPAVEQRDALRRRARARRR